MTDLGPGKGEWIIPASHVANHPATREMLEKLNKPPVIHAPGECPDPAYGRDCDGIGRYGPDPFASEIYGDETCIWQCDGMNIGSAQDI